MKKPELVVPSPNEKVAKLALEAGADTVYLPLTGHVSIRFASKFFSLDDIPPLTDFAHERQKKVFMVANGFPKMGGEKTYQDIIKRGMEIGVDGIVLGSIGLLRWAAKLKKANGYPGSIIASGIVSAVSSRSPRFLAGIGVDRIIVPRLMSIAELGDYAKNAPVEFEVYTHGFLCSAWDGKLCKLPEHIFGRHIEQGACIVNPQILEQDSDGVRLPEGKVLKKCPNTEITDSGVLSFSENKPMVSACFCDFETVVAGKKLPFRVAEQTLQSELFAIPELIKLGTAGFKIIPEGGGEENIAKTVSVWRAAIDSFIESPDTWYVKEEWMAQFLRRYPRVVFDASMRRDFL